MIGGEGNLINLTITMVEEEKEVEVPVEGEVPEAEEGVDNTAAEEAAAEATEEVASEDQV